MRVEEFAKHSLIHIHVLRAWWEDAGYPYLNEIATDYGFMVWDGDRPIASAYLYPVYSCKLAMIGNPISNPLVVKEERRKALDVLVAAIEKKAKELQYSHLMTYSGTNGAKEMFSRLGYAKGDENVTNYCRKL